MSFHRPWLVVFFVLANGYRTYIHLLSALKEVRDHSALNRSTPIISAGLADSGPHGSRPGSKLDAVSIPAAIHYLRENGLDNYADAYGIHVYPSNDPSVSVEERITSLQNDVLSVCGGGGKPCWITEWGLDNNQDCPIDDGQRATAAAKEMDAFQTFVADRRLQALIYFSWTGEPGSKPGGSDIFRCGGVTETGRIVLDGSRL